MNLKNLKKILKYIGVEESETQFRFSTNQLSIPCPLAPFFHSSGTDTSPSCSIKYNVTPVVFKCFTGSCGRKGPFWLLIKTLGELKEDSNLLELAQYIEENDRPNLSSLFDGISDWKELERKEIKVLNSKILENFVAAWFQPASFVYLKSRKVSAIDCTEWGLLFDSAQNRIVFPVYGKNGELYGAVGRVIYEDINRYYNYFGITAGNCLGGFNKLDTDRKKIILVEGFFDLLRIYQWAWDAGFDVVCSWRAEITQVQADLLSALDKSVVVCYDGDSAGEKGWQKVQNLLRNNFGLRRIVPPKDKDMGDLSRVEFENLISRCTLTLEKVF